VLNPDAAVPHVRVIETSQAPEGRGVAEAVPVGPERPPEDLRPPPFGVAGRADRGGAGERVVGGWLIRSIRPEARVVSDGLSAVQQAASGPFGLRR